MRGLHGIALAVVLALGGALAGCGGASDEEVVAERTRHVNLVIVADLSDRILDEKQGVRDLSVIQAALDAWESRARSVGWIVTRDVIRFQAIRANQLANDIYLDLEELRKRPADASGNAAVWQRLPSEKKKFIEACETTYGEGAETRGADLWGFFKDSYGPVTRGEPYINKVVVITDGYLNFDAAIQEQRPSNTQMRMAELRQSQDWEAEFPAFALAGIGKSYDADIMVLEVAPKNMLTNPHELEMLERYWEAWSDTMGMRIKGHDGVARIYMNSLQLSALSQKLREFLAEGTNATER